MVSEFFIRVPFRRWHAAISQIRKFYFLKWDLRVLEVVRGITQDTRYTVWWMNFSSRGILSCAGSTDREIASAENRARIMRLSRLTHPNDRSSLGSTLPALGSRVKRRQNVNDVEKHAAAATRSRSDTNGARRVKLPTIPVT